MTTPINSATILSVEGLDARLVQALSGTSPAAVKIQQLVAAALAGGTAGQALRSLAAGAIRPAAILPSIIQRKGTYRNLITNPRGKTVSGGVPVGWTAAGGATISSVTDGLQVAADATAGRGATFALSGLSNAAVYTAAVRLRAITAAATLRLAIGGQTITSASLAANAEVTLYATWTQSGTTASLALSKTAGSGGFIVLGSVVTAGLYDGPVFDGGVGPAVWDGTSHASTSTTFAGALSVWDGTVETWVNDSLAGLPKVDPVTGNLSAPSMTVDQSPTLPAHVARKDYVDAISVSDTAAYDLKYGRDLGTGTTLPVSGMHRGDVFVWTINGNVSNLVMVYTGTAWRPATPGYVTTYAVLTALPTASLPAGLKIITTSAFNREWDWVGYWSLVGGPFPRFLSQPSVAQGTSQNWDDLLLPSEVYDTDNGHVVTSTTAGSWYTAPYEGWYRVSGTGAWVPNGTGVRGLRWVLRPASTGVEAEMNAMAALHLPPGAVNAVFPAPSREVWMAVGDSIKLQVYQNSGGTLNTVAGLGQGPFVEVVLVRTGPQSS